jgi:hypothetical protein
MLSIVRKPASRLGCDDVDQWIRLSDWRSVKPSRYDGKRSEESNANGLTLARNANEGEARMKAEEKPTWGRYEADLLEDIFDELADEKDWAGTGARPRGRLAGHR